jgi:phage gp29-like protein
MSTTPSKNMAKTGRKASTRTLDPSGAFASGLKKPKNGSSGPGGLLAPAPGPRLANRAPAGARSMTKRLEAWSQHREQYNPLRGLTLARAVSLLEDYPIGRMADLQWTYYHIEQSDADLLALIELGLSRIAEMDWDIVASEEAEPALAEAQVAFLRERFDHIANLEEAIEHLAMARFRGYAHCEIIRDAAGLITELAIVDQWNVVRDGLRGPWKYNPEARATSYAALPAEYEMPPERFLTREVRRPVNRLGLLKFIRSSLSEKDWDAFVEIYGIPSGVVIGPPNVPEDREAQFEAAAGGIAEGGSGYLPNGSTYTQNKAEAASSPFKARLDHLTEKLILAGTGGKLTMLTDATGLGSGASDAHSQVFDSIASAEAGRISREITKQIVAAELAAAFPGQPQVAYFRIAANEETDTSAIIADVVALSTAFDLDAAEVSERVGWKVTRRAAPAALPGGFSSALMNRIRNRASAPSTPVDARRRALVALSQAQTAESEDAFAAALAAAEAALAEAAKRAAPTAADPLARSLAAGMSAAAAAKPTPSR